MARPRKQIDKNEIDEIIELYIDSILKGRAIEISNNGVSNFNKIIANNREYIRKNGEYFNLYGYTVWAGQYKGEDYYGKKKIKEIKEENEIKVVGEGFSPEVLDIVKLVEDLKNKPEILLTRLCSLFNREREKTKQLQNQVDKLKQDKQNLEAKINLMDISLTNFMFQSQSVDNSLNDMFNMSKSTDGICFNELCNMFNEDNARINSLLNYTFVNNKAEENVIDISLKHNSSKYKDL